MGREFLPQSRWAALSQWHLSECLVHEAGFFHCLGVRLCPGSAWRSGSRLRGGRVVGVVGFGVLARRLPIAPLAQPNGVQGVNCLFDEFSFFLGKGVVFLGSRSWQAGAVLFLNVPRPLKVVGNEVHVLAELLGVLVADLMPNSVR